MRKGARLFCSNVCQRPRLDFRKQRVPEANALLAIACTSATETSLKQTRLEILCSYIIHNIPTFASYLMSAPNYACSWHIRRDISAHDVRTIFKYLLIYELTTAVSMYSLLFFKYNTNLLFVIT